MTHVEGGHLNLRKKFPGHSNLKIQTSNIEKFFLRNIHSKLKQILDILVGIVQFEMDLQIRHYFDIKYSKLESNAPIIKSTNKNV